MKTGFIQNAMIKTMTLENPPGSLFFIENFLLFIFFFCFFMTEKDYYYSVSVV